MNETKSDVMKADFKKVLAAVQADAGTAIQSIVQNALAGLEVNVDPKTLTDVERAKFVASTQKYIMAAVTSIAAQTLHQSTGISLTKLGRNAQRACNKLNAQLYPPAPYVAPEGDDDDSGEYDENESDE